MAKDGLHERRLIDYVEIHRGDLASTATACIFRAVRAFVGVGK